MAKCVLLFLIFCSFNLGAYSQKLPEDRKGNGENQHELKVIYINKDVTTHLVSMEEIKYVKRAE